MNRLSLSLTTGFFLVCGTHALLAKKQIFTLDEDRVHHAQVSSNGRTRILVQGDRIKDVMGLPEDMPHEKDEQNGVLFLSDIKTPLSISIITESGLVQDMELQPASIKSSQIVLRDVFKAQEAGDKEYLPQTSVGQKSIGFRSSPMMTSLGGEAATYHQKNLSLIKRLYRGEGEELSDTVFIPKYSDLTIVYKKSIQENGMSAHLFEIKNKSAHILSLSERSFMHAGVSSIALTNKSLVPQQKAYLFIVSK